jgi:hypothetical protein
VQQVGDQFRFAAVDDNTNTLQVWTIQTEKHHEHHEDHGHESG